MWHRITRWVDSTVVDIARQVRFSYLPPLMVYLAAGVSGLTGIVGTFFVKDYLGLSAEFLAALGFWAGIPWALKMPLGHLVDLFWRWKGAMVFLGAGLIGSSLAIMLGLLGHRVVMAQIMSVEYWFVLGTLLAPIGYVMQDVVADAMTIEAVPHVDERGRPVDPATLRSMHTTMQTLGRIAIVGGGILVALVNLVVFDNAGDLGGPGRLSLYQDIYRLALVIPVISVLGVVLGEIFKVRRVRQIQARGYSRDEARDLLEVHTTPPKPNWWILGGSLVFAGFTVLMGLSDQRYRQEFVFAGSLVIVLFLVYRLARLLEPDARRTLVGTAVIIFVYRALPGPGAGAGWWEIDVLGFDEAFFAELSLIASALALLGMFVFRRFMAERPIAHVVVFLTLASTLLSLPFVGMFYGLHEWTASVTGGVVDARFIALVDTTLESPLGQVAMIPMLAWIANSAPAEFKATFFAVMASFTNLALSFSQLATRYLNQLFIVAREVRDPVTGLVSVPADYGDLGPLLITVTVLTLCLPLLAIALVRIGGMRSA